MRPGVLCVMDCGQTLMHKWPVDSLDTHLQVTVIDLTITVCMCFNNLKCEWNSCTLNLLFGTSNLLHFGFEILSYHLFQVLWLTTMPTLAEVLVQFSWMTCCVLGLRQGLWTAPMMVLETMTFALAFTMMMQECDANKVNTTE